MNEKIFYDSILFQHALIQSLAIASAFEVTGFPCAPLNFQLRFALTLAFALFNYRFQSFCSIFCIQRDLKSFQISMSALQSLEFSAILPELQKVVVESFLDLPTRLSFSMTCRKYRDAYFPGELSYGYYDSCKYMEECARLGYCDLLQYSLANGAAFELRVLEKAFEGNQTEAARLLFPYFHKVTVGARYYTNKAFFMWLFELAGRHGNEELFNMTIPPPLRNEGAKADLFTRRGHFEKVKNFYDSTDLESPYLPCYFAAQWEGATVDYIVSTFADPLSPTALELSFVFRGLCGVGDRYRAAINPNAYAIFKYLLENNFDEFDFLSFPATPVFFDKDIFDFFAKREEIVKDIFDDFESEIASTPSIFALKWLLAQENFSDGELFYEKLWMADLPLLDDDLRGTSEERRRHLQYVSTYRFDSIKYLYEHHGKTYKFSNLVSCSHWVKNVSELKWLIDHCTDKINYHILLGRVTNTRPDLGMEVIRFLMAGVKSKCEPVYLRNAICSPNALELLAFAEEVVPNKKLVEYVHRTDLLAAFIAIDGVYNNERKVFLPSMVFIDRRPRPNLLLLILKWLMRHDVKIDESILEEIIDCHPSKYYQSAVKAMFEGFEFRTPDAIPRQPDIVTFRPDEEPMEGDDIQSEEEEDDDDYDDESGEEQDGNVLPENPSLPFFISSSSSSSSDRFSSLFTSSSVAPPTSSTFSFGSSQIPSIFSFPSSFQSSTSSAPEVATTPPAFPTFPQIPFPAFSSSGLASSSFSFSFSPSPPPAFPSHPPSSANAPSFSFSFTAPPPPSPPSNSASGFFFSPPPPSPSEPSITPKS